MKRAIRNNILSKNILEQVKLYFIKCWLIRFLQREDDSLWIDPKAYSKEIVLNQFAMFYVLTAVIWQRP